MTKSGKPCGSQALSGSKRCYVHASSSEDPAKDTCDGVHDIQNTIRNLREEASEVKRCYTEFDFKALVLATAFFGFMSQFYPEQTDSLVSHFLVWLLCATVIAVLMCISRIGYHKYSTANRNYGYELHIDRTFQYERQYKDEHVDLESRMRGMGWEEAMCAWRVVQPILFETVYDVSRGIRRSLIPLPVRERRFSGKDRHYHWWNTQYLMNHVDNGTVRQGESHLPYNPGRFLRNTQLLTHVLCGAVYLIFTGSYFSAFYGFALSRFDDSRAICFLLGCLSILHFAVWVCLTAHLVLSMLRQHSRRHILEHGLLSIQSCAVVWRLVALAHLRAVKAGFDDSKTDYRGYTRRLADNACLIRDKLFDIHETIMRNNWPTEQERKSAEFSESVEQSDGAVAGG
jgi:hypothetical protein